MPVTIITGGSGLIGRSLTEYLTTLGHQVIIFSRENKETNLNNVSFCYWNPEKNIIDEPSIMMADYIINLAGAGVMEKNWSTDYKREILESRVKSGLLLFETIKKLNPPVKAFISASAIGWYGDDKKYLNHPYGFVETDPPAKEFLGETCLLWEDSVDAISTLRVRTAKLRLGIVLANEGGAFPEFKKSLNWGVASILGNGKQIVSWIHIEDVCRMIHFVMQQDKVSGVYNAVAPEPVSNKELILATARQLRNKFFVPVHVPRTVIRFLLGQRSTEILKSTTVSCSKIKKEGFTFLYPTIKLALENLSLKDLQK